MSKFKTFEIFVRCLVPYGALDADDQDYWGEVVDHVEAFRFKIDSPSLAAALDEFHASIPIACLEDFEVEAVEVRE